MTPLHLAVLGIKMVECLLDQGADINIQDDNEVFLHTNAVEYFELAGRSVPIVNFLCCLKTFFSLQATKLGFDL